MKTLQKEIPDWLDENEVLIILAAKLYESQKVSIGQAAAIAGLSKRTFIEIAGKYGVSISLLLSTTSTMTFKAHRRQKFI